MSGSLCPSIETILAVVSARLSVPVLDLRSNRRDAPTVFARHLAMYLARHATGLSFTEIGHAFGDRHHSTVMHAVRRVAHLVEDEPATAALLSASADAIHRATAESEALRSPALTA
jgi:chromosomal replication initiator protein